MDHGLPQACSSSCLMVGHSVVLHPGWRLVSAPVYYMYMSVGVHFREAQLSPRVKRGEAEIFFEKPPSM